MNDLDNVRTKDVADLTDNDKKVLNEGWDKLTSEEHDFFGTVHKVQDEGFKLPFKSQDEFDTYVADKATSIIEERKKAEEDKNKPGEPEESYFPKDYKADDWNKPFQTVVPKIVDKVVSEIEKRNQARRTELEKINQDFDKELDTIASKNPALPQKGTKERDDWEADVAAVGQKYKVHTMKDAYEIWDVLNKAKPAGEPQPADMRTEGTPVAPQPASVADKVGRGYGQGAAPHKTMYKVGGGKRLDEMIEARMKEEGMES